MKWSIRLSFLCAVTAFPVVLYAQGALPRYEPDPYWPKSLPNHWMLGQVSGTARITSYNVCYTKLLREFYFDPQ